MATSDGGIVKFRKRKKRKVHFAAKNRVRYFDKNNATEDIDSDDEEDQDMEMKNNDNNQTNHNHENDKNNKFIMSEDDDDNENELKYDINEADPLYDAQKDRSDQRYIQQKYAQKTAIQSDCTVCCANCFVFISYISQKFSFCFSIFYSLISSVPCTKYEYIDIAVSKILINVSVLKIVGLIGIIKYYVIIVIHKLEQDRLYLI